jgi:hypothetical protein
MPLPPDHEMRLIAAFFGDRKGYFVEVGARRPFIWSRRAGQAC